MEDSKQHWENIYTSKTDFEVSWFQENPETSLRLIEQYSLSKKDISIADIGGGNSVLALKLVNKGFNNISVLDISAKALERNRNRVKEIELTCIESDVLNCTDLRNITIWHDRAVFHFLTNEEDIKKYVQISSKAISEGGYLILATFSETGPDKCSGLPITKYSQQKLTSVFGEYFELMKCFEEVHNTPFGTKQDFIWGVLRRK